MLEELWTEVYNTVQEAVTKTIPKKKKCRKAKWLSEEALQIAEKRRGGGRPRRKGKIYPSECAMQRNRGKQQNGKTGGLFKKIRDTKGTCHAKIDTIKDRAV